MVWLFLLFLFIVPEQPRQNLKKYEFHNIKTVILDPGHGGVNKGALSSLGIYEKVITLNITKKLGKFLKEHTNLNVILTRTGDESLSLKQRVKIANKNNGDIFISLHCNSIDGGIASGVETFFLSEKATDEVTERLCKFENIVFDEEEKEEDGVVEFKDYFVNKIVKDLKIQAYHELSEKLGAILVEKVSKKSGMIKRGVKQAPFGVLKGLMMPGIVFEMGFISNPEEAEYILTDDYQEIINQSILETLLEMDRIM